MSKNISQLADFSDPDHMTSYHWWFPLVSLQCFACGSQLTQQPQHKDVWEEESQGPLVPDSGSPYTPLTETK